MEVTRHMESNHEKNFIPKFSFKSALIIFFSSIVSGIVFPYIFYQFNWNIKLAVLIFVPLSLAFSLAYTQCFVETKIKMGAKFLRIFLISYTALEIAAYAWLFKGIIF